MSVLKPNLLRPSWKCFFSCSSFHVIIQFENVFLKIFLHALTCIIWLLTLFYKFTYPFCNFKLCPRTRFVAFESAQKTKVTAHRCRQQAHTCIYIHTPTHTHTEIPSKLPQQVKNMRQVKSLWKNYAFPVQLRDL